MQRPYTRPIIHLRSLLALLGVPYFCSVDHTDLAPPISSVLSDLTCTSPDLLHQDKTLASSQIGPSARDGTTQNITLEPGYSASSDRHRCYPYESNGTQQIPLMTSTASAPNSRGSVVVAQMQSYNILAPS
ncbi:hypothetical protein SNOG_09075 [Parastagonospora nodorum SN15]|uniref:Uncharacterized protein n=1 Tax=Phaeosphaeria nodorum (strain SN15 / ATCC MYA-4574 / FGSC 10173) TaxID=321614 RepID=Q0UGN9_PHANO|nr:hypothetical protein SNOG_09075 [Parastagonospora nodorum SN15]EAT83267.1 hypothetical protein SNOG_09075 [Parastagonospora nodorum SN15]